MDEVWVRILATVVCLCAFGALALTSWAAFRTLQRVEQIAAKLGVVSKPQGSGDSAPQRVAEKRPISG